MEASMRAAFPVSEVRLIGMPMNLPHWEPGGNPVIQFLKPLFLTRGRNLRLLSHTRRLLLLMLPLGALTGWIMAWVLRGASHLSETLVHHLGPNHLILALPILGLVLATNLLARSGVGEVSLAEDIHMSHADPYVAFPFRAQARLFRASSLRGFSWTAFSPASIASSQRPRLQ